MRVPATVQAPAIRRDSRHGFTVLELMLSVAIMTVIVIGLYTVFDVTQRALRSTMSQVDVLEGIRATTDLMVRDLEGAVPVKLADTNLTSFAAGLPAKSQLVPSLSPATEAVALQGLRTGGEPILSTALQEIFFVNRQNDLWTSIGYWVGPISTNLADAPVSVGRLYRFSYATNSAAFAYTNLYNRFDGPLRLLTSQPVMDGVVHLRVVAYDLDGKPLVSSLITNTPVTLRPWFIDPMRAMETAYQFRRVTVPPFPSALELEIGVLEPHLVTRFASIPVAAEARKFLARNAGKVHLFRQRIPLRNATPF